MLHSIGPYIPGLNDTPEGGLYLGDARSLAKSIPDYSIDLLLTDPVYDQFADFTWIAELAKRTLKKDGHLLTFYGLGYTEETYRALREGGMKVKWPLIIHCPGQTQRVDPHLFSTYYGLLWCSKGGRMVSAIPDVQVSHNSQLRGPNEWRWRKNSYVLAKIIAAYTRPGDVILDPFAGFCSIPEAAILCGRRYLGFERDEEKVVASREHLKQVQPVMFAPDGVGFKNMSIFDVMQDGDEAPKVEETSSNGHSKVTAEALL